MDISSELGQIQQSQASDSAIPPGGFKITVAVLHHGSPANEYPIGSFIQKITIFEDIELDGVTGWLEMLDTYNLVRNGLIIGEELLYLKFMSAGVEEAGLDNKWSVDFSEQPLYVHKIEDMTEMSTTTGGKSQSGLTYKLHFCSPELLRNERTKISKSLQGTYTDLVKKILVNELKTTKNLMYEDTEDLKHVIIPNISPMQAINMMASSCQSLPKSDAATVEDWTSGNKIDPKRVASKLFDGRMTDYHFWETSRGYKLLPVINKWANTGLHITVGGATATTNYLGTMTTSLSHSFDFHGDTFSSIPTGVWAAKQITHDATNKYVNTYQSNYMTSLDNEVNSFVSKTPVFTPDGNVEKNIMEEDKRLTDFPNSVVMMDSYNGQSISNINNTKSKSPLELSYPWTLDPFTISLRRQMQVVHGLNYQLMTVRLYGISALEAGMNVKLDLPDVGRGSNFTQLKESREIWENRLDNIWVIKKLVHTLETTQDSLTYYCDLQLANTLRAADDTLPTYPGLGSSKYETTGVWNQIDVTKLGPDIAGR